jgi:serpin B
LALLAVALVATACGGGQASTSRASGGPGASTYVLAHDVAMVAPPADLDLRPFVTGMRAFGHALGSDLTSQASNGNLVYSPLSLALALALVREGARGKTAAQIDRALHLPANYGATFDALIRALRSDDANGNTLEVGDALFSDPSLPLRSSYVAALKNWYDAGVHQVAFPKPALRVIDGYVRRQTHGRIPRIFDDLNGDVLALVDTVYLHASWAVPFARRETAPAAFTTSSGRHVSIDTMSRVGKFAYASGAGWQAVRLPYRGHRLSMWVLLPSGSMTPLDLLSSDVLDEAANRFSPTGLELDLPKWNAGSSLDLKDVLPRLGLTSLMGGSPDLSGMTPTGLQVGQAVQEATISVAERGTVAGAATGMAMMLSAAAAPVTLDVDHPFAYAIVDDHSGMPLFEGVESDPSQGGPQ